MLKIEGAAPALSLFGDLCLDILLEGLVRLSPNHRLVVDQKSGGALYTDLLGKLGLRRHKTGKFVVIETGVKGCTVQIQADR